MLKIFEFDGITFGQCKDAQRGDEIKNNLLGKKFIYGNRGRPSEWLKLALGIKSDIPKQKKESSKETQRKDPYDAPFIVRYLRDNICKCKQYIKECSVLTKSPSLNRPSRRFTKGEIYDSNFCDLLCFDYLDLKGYDAIFHESDDIKTKLSLKTEKNPIAPRKKVVDITLSNPTGNTKKNGEDSEFDYLIIAQTEGNCALMVCDKVTALKYQIHTNDQIKLSIPLNAVFWIIHPDEKIRLDYLVDEQKTEKEFEQLRNGLIILARNTIRSHEVGCIISENNDKGGGI